MRRLVIDGENLLFRSFWASYNEWYELHPEMCVHFFLNIIRSYITQFNPHEIIVTWDDRDQGLTNKRKKMNEDYKSTREYNKDIHRFVPNIKRILTSLGVRQIHPMELEADDIMYWLCAYKFPGECTLISTDTDMYQLVLPELEGNVVWNPTKKEKIDSVYLLMNYNVRDGHEFIIKKAIRGDKADNIEGVKGIRQRKIEKIIKALGRKMDFDNLRKSKLLSDENVDKFIRNCQLMKLDSIIKEENEVNFYNSQLKESVSMNKQKFIEELEELQLTQILGRSNYWFDTFDLKKDEDVDLALDFEELFGR